MTQHIIDMQLICKQTSYFTGYERIFTIDQHARSFLH